jgi:hypothetical protein
MELLVEDELRVDELLATEPGRHDAVPPVPGLGQGVAEFVNHDDSKGLLELLVIAVAPPSQPLEIQTQAARDPGRECPHGQLAAVLGTRDTSDRLRPPAARVEGQENDEDPAIRIWNRGDVAARDSHSSRSEKPLYLAQRPRAEPWYCVARVEEGEAEFDILRVERHRGPDGAAVGQGHQDQGRSERGKTLRTGAHRRLLPQPLREPPGQASSTHLAQPKLRL